MFNSLIKSAKNAKSYYDKSEDILKSKINGNKIIKSEKFVERNFTINEKSLDSLPNKYDGIIKGIKGPRAIQDRKKYVKDTISRLRSSDPKEALNEIKKIEKSDFYKTEQKKRSGFYSGTISEIKSAKKDIDSFDKGNGPRILAQDKATTILKTAGIVTMGTIGVTTLMDIKKDMDNNRDVKKSVKKQESNLKEKEMKARKENPKNNFDRFQQEVIATPQVLGSMVLDLFDERIGHYKMGTAKTGIVGGIPELPQ